MPVELKVPSVGESVTEVQVGGWLKQPGERVERDEVVVVIETDKATVEVPAPAPGVLAQVFRHSGMKVKVGEVLGVIDDSAGTAARPSAPAAPPAATAKPAPEAKVAAPVKAKVMPAAERLLAERGMQAEEVPATGPGGRLLKEDVQRAAAARPAAPLPADARATESVPMTPLRKTVARRLLEAQNSAALLTTFNEIDMGAVIELRKLHGEAFQQKHASKLGFMSFFVKAVVDALAAVPALNSQVRSAPEGDEILRHHYCDIGVAVGGGRGLVVPVIRNAERLAFAAIEQQIGDFARRAQENKLKLAELEGGTFTISNGGVYGSLLSTPIVNPPQSGVLGLHAIQERPVAREGQVVVRPMMYVALTYDHRIVDGREAVTFLRRVKECVESPARLLLEV